MAYCSTAVLSQAPSLGAIAAKCDPHRSNHYFAFARVKGDVCLVQASYSNPISALMTVDVKIFRHEFISIFRFAEYRTLHPSDISILEPIDERLTRYEEDSETVFLARDVMERMRKLTSPRRSQLKAQSGQGRQTLVVRQQHRQW